MKLISLITVESENAWKLGLEYVCGPKEWWNPEPDIRLIDKTSLCLPQNANIWALSTYIILKQICEPPLPRGLMQQVRQSGFEIINREKASRPVGVSSVFRLVKLTRSI